MLLLLGACVPKQGMLYEGAELPRSQTALVEVNRYSQEQTLRWVITRVSIPDGPKTRGTFEITPGPKRLEVEWHVYDAAERKLFRSVMVPISDVPKRLEHGVTVLEFTPEAGRFYRIRWVPRVGESAEGEPRDMVLSLVDAGMRPVMKSGAGE